ncbi:glycosyltransferase family 87 protein [Tropicimonas marinistellae]|uniref:glycosyltransferase family 87 protein n=1 Tax=Tropicimonas marinistellae TaxID=1739787 RepID=UPI0008324FFC|nr:glycosyltransferase family 87 protein [Tropicimonas marinistellae]
MTAKPTLTPHRPPARTVVLAMTGVACLLAACYLLYQRALITFPSDLSAIYMAARFYDLGQFALIYSAPEGFFGTSPPLWQPAIDELGMTGEFVTPFVYPPLWAAIFSPVAAHLGPRAFFDLAAVVQIPLLAATPFLAWRIATPRAPELGVWLTISGALLFTSQVAAFAVDLLQPQILVTFVSLLAFERYRHGRSVTAGALLGLATVFKLAPAALALIFLLDRDWRSLGSFTATCAVFCIASLLTVGIDLHLAFLASVREVGEIAFLSASNFSVEPLLSAFSVMSGVTPPVDLAARNISFTGAHVALSGAVAKGLFLLLLVWCIWRSGKCAPESRLTLRLLSFALLANLFGPLGWIHYYLLPLFLLPALPSLLRQPWGSLLLVFVALATSHWVFWALYWSRPGDLPVVIVQTGTWLLLLISANALARNGPAE